MVLTPEARLVFAFLFLLNDFQMALDEGDEEKEGPAFRRIYSRSKMRGKAIMTSAHKLQPSIIIFLIIVTTKFILNS